MSWQVVWSQRASNDLRRLDTTTARRVGQAVTRLAETGHGDIKRLRGADQEWRLRVGEWRVRFQYRFDTQTIEVLRVLPRGRAYRD